MFILTSFFFGRHATAAADQKTFDTPEKTVQALLKAAQDENQEEMLAVFGDDGKDLVYSGDTVQAKSDMERFVKAYNTKHTLVAKDDKTRVLQVGASDWPMPIPLVNDGGNGDSTPPQANRNWSTGASATMNWEPLRFARVSLTRKRITRRPATMGCLRESTRKNIAAIPASKMGSTRRPPRAS